MTTDERRDDLVRFGRALRSDLPKSVSQDARARFAADVWREIRHAYPGVNGAWFLRECAMPRWVSGTRHEAAWDRAAANMEAEEKAR